METVVIGWRKYMMSLRERSGPKEPREVPNLIVVLIQSCVLCLTGDAGFNVNPVLIFL